MSILNRDGVTKVLVGVVVLMFAGPAMGQTPKEKAVALTKAGVVLLEEGKLDQALELFEKAYRLDPAPVLLGHIGKVYDKKGDLPKAREYYERWVALESDPERLAKARARLADVLDRMPGTLVVIVSPEGAAVTVDGKAALAGKPVLLKRGTYDVVVVLKGHATLRRQVEVRPGEEAQVSVTLTPLPGRLEVRGPPGAKVTVNGADPRTLPLDQPYSLPPGLHVVEVTASGSEKVVRTVEVRPDETATVDLEAAALAPARPVAVPTEARKVQARVRPSPWPWVVVGAGAAAVAVGALMTVMAHEERGKVSGAGRDGDVVTGVTMQAAASYVDKAKTYDKVSYAMYGIGGAAVVTGVVLALTLRGTAVAALPVADGVALGVRGSF